MRTFGLLAVLAAAGAAGQGARLAVHPLELREMTGAQQEIVQAQFDVMLARIEEIRLAGSVGIAEALTKRGGKGCETRDECLRFFAESTESLYGMYARIRPDPLGAQLLVNARVVRSDGLVIRKVALAAPITEGVELTETARQLLANLLDELELNELSATVPAPTPLEQPIVATSSVRQPTGFALFGIGAAALVTGAVLAGLAVDGQSKLTLDQDGTVPRAQESRALDVARQAQVATVLIPAGALIGLLGGALAWWPSSGQPIALSVLAGSDRADLLLAGSFP